MDKICYSLKVCLSITLMALILIVFPPPVHGIIQQFFIVCFCCLVHTGIFYKDIEKSSLWFCNFTSLLCIVPSIAIAKFVFDGMLK